MYLRGHSVDSVSWKAWGDYKGTRREVAVGPRPSPTKFLLMKLVSSLFHPEPTGNETTKASKGEG